MTQNLEPQFGQRKFYTLGAVAETLGLSRASLRTLIRTKRLRAFRFGGAKAAFRIASDDLAQFVEQYETTSAAEAK